jgi:Putative sensor
MTSVADVFLVLGLVSPRTWLAFIHHLAGLFIGVVAFFVIGYGLALGGLFLPLALASLVLFGLALRFADRLARAERARFAVLLGEPIPAWPAGPDRRFRWWSRGTATRARSPS